MDKKSIKVGIAVYPPLIFGKNDRYTGFEIELWEKIAQRLGITYSYTRYTFKDLLPALKARKVDIALGGITITADRERLFDFSYPIMNTGLATLVRVEKVSFMTNFRTFLNKELFNLLLSLLLVLFIFANIIWLVERGGGGTLDAPYNPGIYNAMWWALTTVSTIGYGDYIPVSAAGRLVGALFILIGLGFFGTYLAQVTSAMTVQRIKSDLADYRKLEGKKVATVDDAIGEQVLAGLGAEAVLVPVISDAFPKLISKEVEAIVFDAPALLAYAKEHDDVQIAGELYHTQSYGFAFKAKSPLREEVNQALLGLYHSGEYDRLYRSWFGPEHATDHLKME